MMKNAVIAVIVFLIMISVLPGCEYITGEKPAGLATGTITYVPGTADETTITSTYVSDSPYQRTVDAVKTLQNTKTVLPRTFYYKEREEFNFNTMIKGEGWFDINDYFNVLSHIAMQDGYVLDYVYYDYGSGGHPLVYARARGQKPFENYIEFKVVYRELFPSSVPDNLVGFVKDKTNTASENKIIIDDSKEGFFEYVVLQMIGGQYYLNWHSFYTDIQIICDPFVVDNIVEELKIWDVQALPAETIEKAYLLDYEPVIVFHRDTVEVSVMTFSKWGGFVRMTTVVNRKYPHTIIDVQEETILEYYCGLSF